MANYVKKCFKGPIANPEAGVTMLEMIAALSLTALLVGVLSQLLFSGVRLWSAQDRAYLKQHRVKYIYQTLANDLNAAVVGVFLPEAALKGDDLKMQFWRESAAGLVQVAYSYDAAAGTVSRAEHLWGQEVEAVPVFKEIKQWKLEYFRPKWKSWVTEWDPEVTDELPSLVRVTLATKAGNLGTLTFPLKVCNKKEE